MDKQTIRQARQSDLPSYLLKHGENLIKKGNRYKHPEHDSLTFTENSYYWNSKGEHGNAIDFLMKYYGMDFNTAVIELTGQQKKETAIQTQTVPPFSFVDISICNDMRRAVAYLSITRSIDISIIQKLIKNKYIYQESETNNIIFPMYDENNIVIGVETVGTLSDIKYKGIKAGSKYGYGFNIGFADVQGIYSYALFFESAIDLISFIEIEQIKNKALTGCLLVSLAGVKENIINHTLNAFKSDLKSLQCVLCVDNDTAGQNLLKSLTVQNKSVKTHFPDSQYKDWNEQLKAVKGGIK